MSLIIDRHYELYDENGIDRTENIFIGSDTNDFTCHLCREELISGVRAVKIHNIWLCKTCLESLADQL